MARRNNTRASSLNGAMPVVALVSNDQRLTETVRSAAGAKWSVVNRAIPEISTLIREPNVQLVVFDDQSVPASDRGWTLAEIQRCASRASIIYVAGEHDQENEKQARARGLLFYTAKPLLPGDVNLLLQRLLQTRNGNRDLANPQPGGQG
jgi:DNA-binding NtrC family response regulator